MIVPFCHSFPVQGSWLQPRRHRLRSPTSASAASFAQPLSSASLLTRVLELTEARRSELEGLPLSPLALRERETARLFPANSDLAGLERSTHPPRLSGFATSNHSTHLQLFPLNRFHTCRPEHEHHATNTVLASSAVTDKPAASGLCHQSSAPSSSPLRNSTPLQLCPAAPSPAPQRGVGLWHGRVHSCKLRRASGKRCPTVVLWHVSLHACRLCASHPPELD